jgi:hypothetical protein
MMMWWLFEIEVIEKTIISDPGKLVFVNFYGGFKILKASLSHDTSTAQT